MLDSEFLTLCESSLSPLGARPDDGEEFREPPLDVLRYFVRPIRLSRLPILGRGLSIVAVVRQPVDLARTLEGTTELMRRVATAVAGRYPPVRGLAIGLTITTLTPEPIAPDDDGLLQQALEAPPPRTRCVPLGLLRLNLGQEALAFALARGPDDLFPDPEALADALTPHFRRFVPLIEGGF